MIEEFRRTVTVAGPSPRFLADVCRTHYGATEEDDQLDFTALNTATLFICTLELPGSNSRRNDDCPG